MNLSKIKTSTLVGVLAIALLLFSSVQIIKWINDSMRTHENIEKVISNVEVEEIEDNQNTEIIEQEEINEANPYWDYINMNLLSVNFNELKNINSDINSWISLGGTNINYPVVQTNDNKFYLNHSIDKSYNEAGWVFMDYRNTLDDKNTIFYAHGRLDNTMFGSLKNIEKSDWYQNTDNHIVRVSTEYENSLWQVFSVYQIPVTSDYISINFDSDEKYLSWLNMLQNRSIYSFDTTLNSNDRIITLSTCLGDDRVVLHAKLIKKEAR